MEQISNDISDLVNIEEIYFLQIPSTRSPGSRQLDYWTLTEAYYYKYKIFVENHVFHLKYDTAKIF